MMPKPLTMYRRGEDKPTLLAARILNLGEFHVNTLCGFFAAVGRIDGCCVEPLGMEVMKLISPVDVLHLQDTSSSYKSC